MTIKIEKGLPIRLLRKRASKYPFAKMEVGDSFFVDGAKSGVLAARCAYWNKLGCRFIARTEGTGARVWRIK